MIVAWQGWKIEVPDRWSPVKIEGDAQSGYLLMADLNRPRLGIRWRKQSTKRFDPANVTSTTMRQEVGELETAKAQPYELGDWVSPLLYEDREPPGRDLFVAYSPKSGRLFQVVYHAHHRDRILTQRLLPTLTDTGTDGEMDWSVFELSCRMPAGWHLVKHRLNAGDLSLMFEASRRRVATVRQIAPAALALSRWPLERWIADQASWRGREFKLMPTSSDAAADVVARKIGRRRRFSWMFWLDKGYVALAKHDQERNRLVIVDASDEQLAREVLNTIGWARVAVEQD
jgi:hypothetical protein